MEKTTCADVIGAAYARGYELESRYGGCAQCVLAALQDVLSPPGVVAKNDDLFRAASGLAGGMGSSGAGNCGAFTGAAMVLSALCGRTREAFGEKDRTRRASDLVFELFGKFEDTYGSCLCKGVQTRMFGRSFDLRNEEDRARFREMGAHRDKCPEVVGLAAAWAAEIILREFPLDSRGDGPL